MSLMSTLRCGVYFIAIAAIAAAFATSADAARRRAVTEAVSGLAASHDMRREGGRLCFSDHFHYGTSAGQSNKRAAELAAIRSWADFVDFEYGGTWANYAKSSSKEIKCSTSSAGWICDVSARPCR